MSVKEKKALVTGGAGFIGSHIVQLLIKHGFYVYIIDNLSTGKKINLGHLPSDTYQLIEGSVTNTELIDYLVQQVGYVFHLAAYISVPGSFSHPLVNNETNVSGTLNIFHACLRHKVKKVVFSSSCAVYKDDPMGDPCKNERSPRKPVSPYGLSKKYGEDYGKLLNETMALPVMILRYFNVYGPRQDHKSPYAAAIPIFFQQLINKEPITIYGDGKQTRDFISVKDVAEANLWAAISKRRTGLYNVGTGTSISINDLVKKIFKITGKKVPVKFEPPRAAEIKHIYADIGHINHDLNFSPSFTIEEGLKQLYKWYTS